MFGEDDIYALEEFIREKHLEAHKNRIKCEHKGIKIGEERYASQEFAYGVVMSKIQAMRVNQRPHMARDIDYVL
jgi:hypothetical protein